MFQLDCFSPDPDWIAQRLTGEVTTAQVIHTLDLLERLGLIKKNEARVLRPVNDFYATLDEVPQVAARNFHRSMLKLASKAIVEQAIDRRLFASQTLAVDMSRIVEAKRFLNETLDKFTTKFASRAGSEVYHCSLQFFSLTTSGTETY